MGVAIFEAFFEFGNFQKKTRIDNVRNRHRVRQLERRLVEAALKQVLGQLAVETVVLPTVMVGLEICQMLETRLDSEAENNSTLVAPFIRTQRKRNTNITILLFVWRRCL